ncbi:MAG: bifunctional 4-hydroxy-2-oxoglutarate aldolase/2-dehydro-3-deoxy-phosphogluconate aldolase [Erysipelotrichaceae bacterium]|nr:bifunctional 4-hydroxy-2-oxoglutarate aldolase/2-dehydro-3-deoxy-phosphogluconate aldolase [Erysipelotrichaceae bacterium]
MDILKKIHAAGIVPVVALNNKEDAAPLAEALCKGGLPVAEVTFRTTCAKQVMINMKKACPEMLIGAGTVLSTKQVDEAIECGAEFIVSPGLNPEVVSYCVNKNIPIVPGCANPSDIEIALSYGLDTVKFFPAEPLGGLKMIKALAGPYTNVKFMPTGGINENNISDYLAYDKIVACGGTWMVDKEAIKNKDFKKIENLTRNAVLKMLNIRLKHIGINTTSDIIDDNAASFISLFQGLRKDTTKGCFASDYIELMNETAHTGTHGHIAIGVSSVERAIPFFKNLGYKFKEETVTYDNNGDAKFIYFKDEFAGFAVHLVNN